MPTRDENRAAIWGLLAQHGDVDWHGYGNDVAFADEVLELAARLGRVETVPAMRPVRVATDAERRRHFAAIKAVFEQKHSSNALSAPQSDEQGVAGVPDSGRQRTTEGDE